MGLLLADAGWVDVMALPALLQAGLAVHVVCHCCRLLVVWQA